ncbi:MAG: hypothetical protein HRU15_09215, partial [Planctomycetes bacterium]|nr:hypothetical protein [Planctomycetota bacterium]
LGVILFELLTLKTPQSMQNGERLSDFIERIINGKGKRKLGNEWTDAPQALCEISKKSLQRQAGKRYRSCSEFMDDIRTLLEELSASYSELERQRLEQDRQGAWIPVGSWDYTGDEKRMKPFTEMVTAYEGEAVGQLLHHDRGGMLFGGCGLQIYPCAVNVGDDIRVNMEFSVLHGSELWIFLRGIPPISCYAFRIGSHDGRWLTVSRVQSVDKIFQPEMLTMRALSDAEATALFSRKKKRRKRRLDIEIVGSTLRIAVDGEDPLIVQDPCPLIGPMHQQLALGTLGTQIVVHNFSVEQRRSPLMVPSFEVANELLRQNLYPQAITYYQKFLEEQLEVDQRTEAHFMLCLAFQQAGHVEQSEQELHNFLLGNIDHRLSRDAIFELARLRTGNDYKRIESGIRVVLSYQEADDRVRSRFCLWASDLLHDTVFLNGIDDSVIEALRLMKHLIRGFSDELVLLDTISGIIIKAITAFGSRLIDLQAYEQFEEFKDLVKECRDQNFDLYPEFPHAPKDYLEASREVTAAKSGKENTTQIIKICKPFTSPRDIICLSALGCADSLIEYIEDSHRTRPVMILCLAALYARIGDADKSKSLLEECFRLMDVIENERTNVEMTTVMRLGMYGLDFLPWQVVWPPISQMIHEPEIQVLTAWLAECLGHHEEALEAYSFLRDSDAVGFRNVIEQAMTRLGLMAEAKKESDEEEAQQKKDAEKAKQKRRESGENDSGSSTASRKSSRRLKSEKDT